MKKLSVLCLLLISFFITNAQTRLPCATEERDSTEFEQLPWFGNNQYLENFLDSIGYPAPNTQNRIVDENIKFWVPVKFWIYRNSNGTGGPTEGQIQGLMDALNRFYNQDNNTWIGFYLKCDPTYINDDQHTIVTRAGATLLGNSNNDQGAVNVHIVENFHFGALGVLFPSPFAPNSIFIQRLAYEGDWMSTLPHEAGHFFNLDHTHRYPNAGTCKREPISRTRTWPTFQFCFFGGGGTSSAIMCESTGDALADTPADPDLLSNNSCDYTLGGTDLYGDSYASPPVGARQPDTRNTMSYNGDDNCIDFFSRQQIAVMLHSIHRGRHREKRDYWQHRDGIFDDYEPNNSSEYARPIVFGEIQEHSFHRQYNGNGNNWSQCDVDWISFVPACSGTFPVETFSLPPRLDANTRLTLFNATLTQLEQNDNISGTNLFSRLTWNFVAGQTYFIRVENMSPGSTTYYRLAVNNMTINGNVNQCGSSNFNIGNFPAGATVIWNTSQFIGTFTPPNGNPTVFTPFASGSTSITAAINACGTSTIASRTIAINSSAPTIEGMDLQKSGPPCNSSALSFGASYNGYSGCQLRSNGGITDVEWQITSPFSYQLTENAGVFHCSGSNNVVRGGISVWFSPPGGGPYVVTLRFRLRNLCGLWSEWSPGFYHFVQNCGFMFTVAPNPVKDVLTIQENNNTGENNQVSKTGRMITEIKIFDQSGNLQKQVKYGTMTKQAQVNVAGLKAGIYIIEISSGKDKERQQIIIQK